MENKIEKLIVEKVGKREVMKVQKIIIDSENERIFIEYGFMFFRDEESFSVS